MINSESVSRANSVSHTAATSAMLSNSQLLSPNTQVVVGTHKCEIIEHLAEGGFAHIYKVKFLELTNEMDAGIETRLLKAGDVACLKRVIVPDENGLNELRNEVETMKQLRGSPNIVQYYDSNASRRPDGSPGYEILLLMELCPKGSLLDYMNKKLATKLSESEILKIMFDVTNAIAQVHYLPTPLIHRDIKIENVLVDKDDNFKLCDFGSTSVCFPIVSTHQDIAVLTNNIYVHTTPQYRSPEMIDLYRCLPINEKSDIWALGIFLYKLLFYTTPFELTGQFAILHSKYDIPQNAYSSKLINLIIIMLAENPSLRPNIYQVMYHICQILKCDVPFSDKYELGPYDFDKYAQYHSKLQQIQYQMFELYNKKNITPVDIDNLNSLFIQNFEIAPKEPVYKVSAAASQPDSSEDELDSDLEKMDEFYPTVEKLESGNLKGKDDNHLNVSSSSVKKSNSRSTSEFSNRSQISLSSVDKGSFQGARTPPPPPAPISQSQLQLQLQYPQQQQTQQAQQAQQAQQQSQAQQQQQPKPKSQQQQQQNTENMSATKQHKQYNPFQAQYQPELGSSDYFQADNDHYFKETPPMQKINDKASSYFHQPSPEDNKQPPSLQVPTQNHKFDTGVSIPEVTTTNTNTEYLLDLSPPQGNVSNNNNNNNNNHIVYSVSGGIPTTLPRNIPTNMPEQGLSSQPLVQSISQQNQNSANVPPVHQPLQHRLDLTFDQVDLSKHSLTRQSDTEVEESVISDESISLDLKQTKTKEASAKPIHRPISPVLENNDFPKPKSKSSKAPQRKSLDLKYQEINLSSEDQRIQRKAAKPSFSRNSIRRSVEMERMKHDSNSSNSRDDSKESKRRSFFGVFK